MIEKSCKFVESSDLFFMCPLAWQVFIDSEPDATWGTNIRSLIDASIIKNILINHFDEDDDLPDCRKQIDIVLSRIETLSNILVDLEN